MTIKSEAFSILGLTITWYGILITIGMMLAMMYAFSRMRSFGLDADRAIDGIIGGVIGGIIGARVYYVIFHWADYAGDWKAIFNIRNGGLGIYGGLIGALIIGSIVCKLRKVRLLPIYDIVSLGFLIGQCIGRWGNFMNHEAFGKNTESIFGMTSGRIQTWISRNYPDGSVIANQPVHPCFFYESMWCLLGFIILHFVSKKAKKFDGQIFLMYVIWYGTGRFFIESLRTDSLYLGTVKISQLVAVLSVITAFILLCIGFSHVNRMGGDYQLYCDTEESIALLKEADARLEKTKESPETAQVILAEKEEFDEEKVNDIIAELNTESPQREEELKAEKEKQINDLLKEIAEADIAKETEPTETEADTEKTEG
ncbi:MAG: prolipoprotein diacylglyceryl transferase [Oscillospiraceae bacterium]|nr:prolipoprotein diacylglyceryl transferase [Oscillospiraceae bacterium]